MKRILFSSCLFCTLALVAFSSEDPLEKLVAGFRKYLEELPQEKVYLHFDRPYYTSGETIWFKAYLTAGALHEPSPFSRTIYVELINEQQQLVEQIKLLSIKGSAAGDLVLPDSLPSGNYVMRAYTNWMRNGDEDYFFHSVIKIWNSNQPATAAAQKEDVDVQFFPEGGDLVNGITSKVAFKAIGSDGLGRKIQGNVVDESGSRVAEIRSNFLGMGVFSINPSRGKKYKAIIENLPGEFSLPVAKEEGVVLSVGNALTLKDLSVRIQLSNYQKQKTIYLLAQTRGVVCYAASVNLSSNVVLAKMPKDKFPEGVSQITVLDITGNPLAERLVFIEEQKKSVSVEVSFDKASYQPREKIELTVTTKDAKGNPIAADLSMSVCDDQQVLLDENRENIYSYLYLSSELKGHIESPGYYFNIQNKDRLEALDYLLMTQGWRRFITTDLSKSDWKKPEYSIEQGLTIKGRMLDKFNNKPIADGKVTYLVVDPAPSTTEVRTNASGYFEMNHVIYFDSAQAVIQGQTRKGNKWVKLVIDSLPDFPATHYAITPLSGVQTDFEKNFIAASIERKKIDEAYNFDEKTILLDAVEIKDKKEELPSTVTKIYGNGSVSRRVADDPSLENMLHPLQLLQGRVAGVQVTGGGQNWSVMIRGVGSINAGTAPMILVDNIPVSMDYLSVLRVRDIDSYEVWKGPETAIFGAQGANGVIGFYTKRGTSYAPPREGVFRFGQVGYQTERDFYSPKYDVQKPEHVKPDRRITLYWAPLVQTDSTGRTSIIFYNHDLETTVTGLVEGLSTTGKPATSTFKYAIRKN